MLVWPSAPVTPNALLIDPVAPIGDEVIEKFTVTPETGFPPTSVTFTTNGLSTELIAAVWPLPLTAAIVVAEPAVAVAVKTRGLPVSDPEVASTT